MTLALLAGLVVSQSVSPLDDPNLSKIISARADAEPIHVTLESIGKQTGTRIYANPGVGQDRIILLAKNLPAKEILKKISDHFGWSWRTVRDGIELWQTPVQATEEKRALNEAILNPLRRWRQTSIEALKRRQGFDPGKGWNRLEELARQSIEHVSRYNEEYFGTDDQRKAWSGKMQTIEQEMGDLGRKMSPVWGLMDTVVANLTDNDLLHLHAEGRLVVAYSPKGGQLPMSRTAQQMCEEYVKFRAGRNWDGDVERSLSRALEMEGGRDLKPDAIRNIRIHLKTSDTSNFSDTARATDLPEFFVVDSDFKLVDRGIIAAYSLPTTSQRPRPVEQPVDELDKPLPQTEALKAAIEPGPHRIARAVEEAQEKFFMLSGVTFSSGGHARILNEVADAAGVNFIGDCNDWNRFINAAAPGYGTARQAFQGLARSNNENWKFENGWVSFRDPQPAIGRACSVPSNKLLLLRDKLVGPFSLDNGGAAVNLITDMHTRSRILETWFYSRWGLLIRSNQGMLPLLRFWGALPAGIKRGLQSGSAVPLSAIGRSSLDHLMRFFRSGDRDFNTTVFDYGETGDAEDYQWVKENLPLTDDWQRDHELTELLPNGPDLRGTIRLRQSVGTAFKIYSPQSPSWSMTLGTQSAIVSGYFNPEKDHYQYNLLKEYRNFFLVDLAANIRRGFVLKGFGTPETKLYERVADLPEDLRKKLEADYRKRKGG